ncbi:MAG: hypothetical protein LBM04_05705 [Opitutaceae bacterium]|nr:hypothetical protein [Opitutaceae bacterium]
MQAADTRRLPDVFARAAPNPPTLAPALALAGSDAETPRARKTPAAARQSRRERILE